MFVCLIIRSHDFGLGFAKEMEADTEAEIRTLETEGSFLSNPSIHNPRAHVPPAYSVYCGPRCPQDTMIQLVNDKVVWG
jgi:hypothetical protein